MLPAFVRKSKDTADRSEPVVQFAGTACDSFSVFVFPEEESNTKQNHAEIRYDKTLDLYQIRSLRGNGCFLKIEQKIVSNYIITLFSY